MGEKYDALNQKGCVVVNQVEEKFCFQGEKTYCPAPFFWTDSGFGLYVDTCETTTFHFDENSVTIDLPESAPVVAFSGEPAQIVSAYMELFGKAVLPPEWAFGVWISANRWNCQKDAEQQIENLKKHDFPASILVLEAWSDEATFYIWNGAKYQPKPDGAALQYDDFDFSDSPWPDPKGMADTLHKAGLHLVLWQIPVYKKQGPDEILNVQNTLDREDAVRRGLCVRLADGTPYTIPDGHWFSGSMIPDYTNPETVRTWFAKRQYLLDMGVDGFKTDGGEFIYRPDVRFPPEAAQRAVHRQAYTRPRRQVQLHLRARGRTAAASSAYCQPHTPAQSPKDTGAAAHAACARSASHRQIQARCRRQPYSTGCVRCCPRRPASAP